MLQPAERCLLHLFELSPTPRLRRVPHDFSDDLEDGDIRSVANRSITYQSTRQQHPSPNLYAICLNADTVVLCLDLWKNETDDQAASGRQRLICMTVSHIL
jgi:hypothetical protein